jgi:hypothetical protein
VSELLGHFERYDGVSNDLGLRGEEVYINFVDESGSTVITHLKLFLCLKVHDEAYMTCACGAALIQKR